MQHIFFRIHSPVSAFRLTSLVVEMMLLQHPSPLLPLDVSPFSSMTLTVILIADHAPLAALRKMLLLPMTASMVWAMLLPDRTQASFIAVIAAEIDASNAMVKMLVIVQ